MAKILLLAVVLALGLTSSASAECAWVMWSDSSYSGRIRNWTIDSAFDTKDQCVSGLDKILSKSAGSNFNFLLDRENGKLQGTDKQNPNVWVQWWCLPDTVKKP